jgi:hypothetical protein
MWEGSMSEEDAENHERWKPDAGNPKGKKKTSKERKHEICNTN